MADDNAVQLFLDQVRELVPNKALRCGAVTDSDDYKKPVEFKGNKTHRLEILGFGKFTGTPEEILKAVKAKAERLAALEA